MKHFILFTKTLMLVIALVSTVRASAQSVESELQDYFYPFAKFSYIVTPNAENPILVETYSLPYENILTKNIEIWDGYPTKKMSEEAYKLSIDEEKRAIVSTQQVIQNMMGTRRESNRITMFVLPKDSNPVNWIESVNGEKSNCSAKIVYQTVLPKLCI